jgi:phage major head subunit gpT-like protein
MSNFNNVQIPQNLKQLHAQVLVMFDDAKNAAEVDIRSEYENTKRATVIDLVKDGKGDTADMVYALPTMTGRPGDTSDGAMPVFTPGAASVSNRALPTGYLIRIHHSDIRDDRFGLLQSSIQQVAANSVAWKYTTIAQQLPDGLSKLTIDGKAYFATDHYVNLLNNKNGSFSNKLSLALTPDNFSAARTAFRRIPQENGLPRYDNNPDTLLVSAKNETLAESIVANPTLFGGAANPNKGKAQIIVVPEWDLLGGGTYEGAWMLAKTRSSLVKPFIWNEREQLGITYIGSKTTGPLPGLYHEWMVYGEMSLAFFDPRLAVWSAPA